MVLGCAGGRKTWIWKHFAVFFMLTLGFWSEIPFWETLLGSYLCIFRPLGLSLWLRESLRASTRQTGSWGLMT